MSADGQKSKAELRAERRQKQEEQRAAKAAKKGEGNSNQSTGVANQDKSASSKGAARQAGESDASTKQGKQQQASAKSNEAKKQQNASAKPDSAKRPDKNERPAQLDKSGDKTSKQSGKPLEKADKQSDRNDDKVERKADGKDQPRRTRDALRLDDPQVARRITRQLEKQRVPQRESATQKVPFFAHLPQYTDSPTRVLRELSFSADSPIQPAFIRLALLSAYEPSRTSANASNQPNLKPTVGSQCVLHTDSNRRTFMLADALRAFIEDNTNRLLTESASNVPIENRIDELVNRLEKRLQPNLSFLIQFRPLSVSQAALIKFFKKQLTAERQLNLEMRKTAIDRSSQERSAESPSSPDSSSGKELGAQSRVSECATRVSDALLNFLNENIVLAGEAISQIACDKLNDRDHVLTFGFSSCVLKVLSDFQRQKLKNQSDGSAASRISATTDFRVIVLDDAHSSRGGLLMAKALLNAGVRRVEYGCITAVGQHVGRASKVLLGADSLLANGSIVAPCGSALIALAAHTRMIPVLFLCESHKLLDAAQLDAFVNNDLRDPETLVRDCNCADGHEREQDAESEAANKKDGSVEKEKLTPTHCHIGDWRNSKSLTLLNLAYDVCPPRFVSAVITERIGMLPCTSAPIVLRMRTDGDVIGSAQYFQH